MTNIVLNGSASSFGASPQALGERFVDLYGHSAISHVPRMFHSRFVVNAGRLYDPGP